MRIIKKYERFILEKFADDYPKNTWVDINTTKAKYAENIIDIISHAYGGEENIQKDILTDPTVNYWQAIDVDDDPDMDAVLYGKKTKFGIKITGIGQDGGRMAKMQALSKQIEEIKTGNFYCEISDNLLKFMKNVPYIKNQDDVEKIINKKVKWIGDIEGIDGWYEREIDGYVKKKLLVGRPNI